MVNKKLQPQEINNRNKLKEEKPYVHEKIFNRILEIFYPPTFRKTPIFLGNGIFEWVFLIIGIWIIIAYTKIGFLFTIFWIENFFFWIIPMFIKGDILPPINGCGVSRSRAKK